MKICSKDIQRNIGFRAFHAIGHGYPLITSLEPKPGRLSGLDLSVCGFAHAMQKEKRGVDPSDTVVVYTKSQHRWMLKSKCKHLGIQESHQGGYVRAHDRTFKVGIAHHM